MEFDPRLLRASLSPGLLVAGGLRTLVRPFILLKGILRRRRHRERRIAPYRRAAKPFNPERTAAALQQPGPHVVLCGIGLGEFAMMRRVGEALAAARPDAAVSYSLRDLAALEDSRLRFPQANVSWWPTDGLLPALRWLGHQRPDVVILTERIRYPMFAGAARRFGARVGAINARAPVRDSLRHRILAPIYRWTFGAYDALAMGSEASARIARRVVAARCVVRAAGDLKTDANLPSLPAPQLASLVEWLAFDPPLVAAGSTDDQEEERMVLDAFLRVRREASCRLLLAPRHPSGRESVEAAMKERGLSVGRRSEGGAGDVLLLDTQGELAHAYASCVAAYVGGSYAPGGGGHNVMEPLLSGSPVAYGLSRGFFEAPQRLCESHGVGTRIAGAEELAAFWLRYLTLPTEREDAAKGARMALAEGRGAYARTVETMLPLLEPLH